MSVTLFDYFNFYFRPFQGFDQDCQESDQWCPVQHFQAGAFNRNTTYLFDFVNANHFCYEWYWSGPQRGGDDSGTSSVANHQVWPSGISFFLSWFVAMMFKQVDHPYSALLKYAKCLKGDKPKLQKMVGLSTLSNNKSLLQIDNIEFQVQMSWTFVNDSLCTTLCLQWEPEVRFA